MTTEFINPPTAFNPTPRGYSHVVKITRPQALYFVSGAAAVDHDMQVLHVGDVEAQTRVVFQHAAEELEAAGATLADVVDMTIYVADTADQWKIRAVRNEFWPADRLPSSTMIAVKGFCIEGMLIEIDFIAATS
jgi:2-iminobutanoate/2-iminopropanoate deaminase